MANRDKPNGFKATVKLDGSVIPHRWFPVDSGNGTAIFVGDLVTAGSDGNVNPSAADDGITVLGAVDGISDLNEISQGHPNSAGTTKHLPASTAGFVNVALAVADAVFEVQSDSGTSVAESARFATANHAAGAGDTVTSQSRHELDSSDIGTGLQCRIIDKVDEPDNNWDEQHVQLLVTFNESVLKGAGTATI